MKGFIFRVLVGSCSLSREVANSRNEVDRLAEETSSSCDGGAKEWAKSGGSLALVSKGFEKLAFA